MESLVATYEGKLAAYGVTYSSILNFNTYKLSALTLTTIQASQTPIHNNAGFGITLFAQACPFRETLFIHTFTRLSVFF